MNRRKFIRDGCLVVAGWPLLSLPMTACAQAGVDSKAGAADPLNRIGVTSVCFRQWFPQQPPAGGGADRPRKMTLLEFPAFVVKELGLHTVEVWAAHFDDTSIDYCKRLKAAADAVGAKINNIQLDLVQYDLAATDPAERAKSIATVKSWMDRAVACGASSVRANTDTPVEGRPFDPQLIGESFRQLADYGQGLGVAVLVENHYGYSKDIDQAVAVANAANHPNCKTLSDWGNSEGANTEERIVDLSKMFPKLGLVSAKGLRFDANYKHVDYDIASIVKATEKSGYRGIYSIELYVSEPADVPKDPVRAVKSMIAAIAPNLQRG